MNDKNLLAPSAIFCFAKKDFFIINIIPSLIQSLYSIMVYLAAFFNGTLLEANESSPPPSYWLTGPLIAPVGTVVPYGDFLLRSYIFFASDTGFYNQNWNRVSVSENLYNLAVQEFCFLGLTSWCDFQIVPELFYNTTNNEHYVYPGDLTIGLDFQLLPDDFTLYFPGIKLSIKEIFPTGNYQKFSPKKLYTDETGMGTFATQFNLVFYKVYHLHRSNWLSTTLSAQYTVNSPVKIHGFNTYGGGFGTNGTVLLGNQFQAIVSFEVTLSKNWAFALDNVYTYTEATQFYGRKGINYNGTLASIGGPSSEQLGFAPAIEYNFSKKFGIIAGCFFSAAGKNSIEFRSGVINFNYAQ
jgi:hypothetical protein